MKLTFGVLIKLEFLLLIMVFAVVDLEMDDEGKICASRLNTRIKKQIAATTNPEMKPLKKLKVINLGLASLATARTIITNVKLIIVNNFHGKL